MDLIQMTREMGRAMQSDERYIKMQIARQACDEDKELQDQIGEFNLKKMAINMEVQKEIRDEETIKRLNMEFRKLYGEILRNPNMTVYNAAKAEFDQVFQEINGIMTLCADGEDPMTCQYVPSCNGSCGGCSGCQ